MRKSSVASSAKGVRKGVQRAKRAALKVAPDDASIFENAAREISANIRARHMPYGTIMDPVFSSPESEDIVSYTRAGDSAIWTGHYLGAEAFRYRVTGEPDALENARAAIAGLRSLMDITEIEVMARVIVPADSPYTEDIQKGEAGHGVFYATVDGRKYFWIGNTTRDQYSGAMFGLGIAMEVDELRAEVVDLITRIVGYLADHSWIVRMPNGNISTVFTQRPDQQLAFLQIARKANPKKFNSAYRLHQATLSALTSVPIAYEALDDHHSYFKFNLDTANLFHLVRFESETSLSRKYYSRAYDLLWRTTGTHQNAHFNMVDCALKGANAKRDAQTIDLLKAWRRRPARDPYVDLRGQFKACGEDRACDVIPVEQRPTTDFLWQRSPFLLYGGGIGQVEGAGIDFILPYWMARFYRVL